MTLMTFLLSFLGICLAFFLLAVGAIFAHKTIKGSCGSIDDMGIEKEEMKKELGLE